MFVANKSMQSFAKHRAVGVGLRHEHYTDVLQQTSLSVDFIEVHAENFFAQGGVIARFLEQIAECVPMSIHGTSMGLGSATGINPNYLQKFARLVEKVNPVHVSEHACFTWGNIDNSGVHAGDLLPLRFDNSTLQVLVDNIDRVQQVLGRQLLVENIVSYHTFERQDFGEAEFLAQVAEQSGCGLLVDLNNILINLQNHEPGNELAKAKRWLQAIPPEIVGEIHLAGASQMPKGAMLIDDHSQPVSEQCWELYQYAAQRFPGASVLIEWDNNLPAWAVLLQEAHKARRIAEELALELA